MLVVHSPFTIFASIDESLCHTYLLHNLLRAYVLSFEPADPKIKWFESKYCCTIKAAGPTRAKVQVSAGVLVDVARTLRGTGGQRGMAVTILPLFGRM